MDPRPRGACIGLKQKCIETQVQIKNLRMQQYVGDISAAKAI